MNGQDVDHMSREEVAELLRPYAYSFYGVEDGVELWMDDNESRVYSREAAVAWCTGVGLDDPPYDPAQETLNRERREGGYWNDDGYWVFARRADAAQGRDIADKDATYDGPIPH